ncbi:VIT1/CCC1 transporter family protein [Patescibacteria group bacterium]|nr:VIT1/CCC1 transporter family protein [Patescibacteria group bacterium]
MEKHASLPHAVKTELLKAQRNEITEYYVYSRLAASVRNKQNQKTLYSIASEEQHHAETWQRYTDTSVEPDWIKVYISGILARLFGFTFAVKLMEKGEELAQINYHAIGQEIPEARAIEEQENKHERELLAILDEERLRYVSSMVLGLNDALVELTGVLAGLTLALQHMQLIAVTGFISGVAASLSMAASEYLSTRSEGDTKDPAKAAFYTGVMYLITVLILISPFFVASNVFSALAASLVLALVIIFIFTFYISVAQDLPFRKRFLEMAGLSLGVAALTFGLGFVVRILFGIHI